VQPLAQVSLEIMPGEAVGLMGPSGAGKSTLARIALGLELPDSGRVLFKGKDLARLDRPARREYRRRMAMVWQEPLRYLNPYYSVAQLVREPLEVHGLGSPSWRRQRLDELLAMVGLEAGLQDRKPHQLSGGQCQRVALARALAGEPELLVCDEALAPLDTINQARLLRMLASFRKDMGLTIIFISHDPYLVARLCTRGQVLQNGHLVHVPAAGPCR
jgi:ABC-type glutathione transport system ATPase component